MSLTYANSSNKVSLYGFRRFRYLEAILKSTIPDCSWSSRYFIHRKMKGECKVTNGTVSGVCVWVWVCDATSDDQRT